MIEIGIEQEQGSVDEFAKQMRRRAFYLGESMQKNVLFSSWFLARAAAAATRVAPKSRPIVKNPKNRPGYYYAAKKIRNGKTTYMPIRSQKEDVKATLKANHPAAQIHMRGLAKNAWYWCLQEMNADFGTTSSEVKNRMLKRKRKRASIVEMDMNKAHPTIHFGSRLKYASSAFKTKGPSTASSIARRAANSMRKDLERRIRAMK